MVHEVLIKGSTAKGEGKVLKNPVCGRGLFDVVNVWTLEEINPFISEDYTQKISLRKGDYAG